MPQVQSESPVANGVVAEFDLTRGLFRVEGVEGFSGDWEEPDKIER